MYKFADLYNSFGYLPYLTKFRNIVTKLSKFRNIVTKSFGHWAKSLEPTEGNLLSTQSLYILPLSPCTLATNRNCLGGGGELGEDPTVGEPTLYLVDDSGDKCSR